MKLLKHLTLAAILLFSLGCGVTGNLGRNYGKIYSEGEILSCGSFQVRSFQDNLRSSPKIYGENTYVGYLDYGPGWSRGTVFIVLSREELVAGSLGDILCAFAPQQRELLGEVTLLDGRYKIGEEFVARIPEKVKNVSSSTRVIERSEMHLKGEIMKHNSMYYLIMVQNDTATGRSPTELISKDFKQFTNHIIWNSEPVAGGDATR